MFRPCLSPSHQQLNHSLDFHEIGTGTLYRRLAVQVFYEDWQNESILCFGV
jgi:hypothetical protein